MQYTLPVISDGLMDRWLGGLGHTYLICCCSDIEQSGKSGSFGREKMINFNSQEMIIRDFKQETPQDG